jgi:hypothetical protein
MGDNYKSLGEQFPFTPPADEIIPEERFTEYLQIRNDFSVYAEGYFKKFEEIGKKIGNQFESSGFFDKLSGIGSIKEIISTAVNMIPELGGEHVNLLTTHEMSLQEYAWISKASVASLSKAKENNNPEADAIWTDYQIELSEMQKKIDQQNWNQQNNDLNISYNNFLDILSKTEYKAENAALVAANKDKFIEYKHACILDYFIVQFAESELNKKLSGAQPKAQAE